MPTHASPQLFFSASDQQLHCTGDWCLLHEDRLHLLLEEFTHTLPKENIKKIILKGNELSRLDSVGTWHLKKLFNLLKSKNTEIELHGFLKTHEALINLNIEKLNECTQIPKPATLPWIEQFGKNTLESIKELYHFIIFVGEIFYTALYLARHPRHIQWRLLGNVLQNAGFYALPITGLLSFLIGIVLAYQMGLQLRNYGANVFVVDLMALSVLREFAPMITAIIVAGRSGSAFTAQLGSMKINQEIDALSTMGIKPVERLVIPRLFALVVALPLLTVWADALGIFGGMIMANSILDIKFSYFIERFDAVVPMRWYVIGLVKTPVYALLIASIGCFQGLQVEHNADSVGSHTTRSVVQAIFMIITFDAL
ncbi:MAG: hypothetical protein A3B69_02415, partial [Gammaproteobacteria bacterium RIFCSPHIGHO2_02_FULL_38_33]